LPKSKFNADETNNEDYQVEHNNNLGDEDEDLYQNMYDNGENEKNVLVETPAFPIIERDYKSLVALKMPQEGLHIAFKMLEMSELYTPEISNYKEAYIIKVESIGRAQKFVTLALIPMLVKPADVKDSWGPKLNDRYKTKLVYDDIEIDGDVDGGVVPVMEIIREDWDGLIDPLKIGEMSDDIQI
jgi:hypothetical protein